MKRVQMSVVILALAIAMLPSVSVAQQQETDVEGVREASKAFYDALATLDDGKAMGQVWAPTSYITLVGPRSKSIIVGWDAVSSYWANSNSRFSSRVVSLSDQHIHVNGNLAWEMGHETGEIVLSDGSVRQADYLVTNVYEKLDERWYIVSHHVQPKPQ